MEPVIDYQRTFESAYRRMIARRNGTERAFLHVQFLRGSRVVREAVLEGEVRLPPDRGLVFTRDGISRPQRTG